VKDRPKGAVARATAAAEGFAGAVRRRQRDRGPRILLYRGPGDPHLWPPGARGHDELLAIAERMTALAKSANSGN